MLDVPDYMHMQGLGQQFRIQQFFLNRISKLISWRNALEANIQIFIRMHKKFERIFLLVILNMFSFKFLCNSCGFLHLAVSPGYLGPSALRVRYTIGKSSFLIAGFRYSTSRLGQKLPLIEGFRPNEDNLERLSTSRKWSHQSISSDRSSLQTRFHEILRKNSFFSFLFYFSPKIMQWHDVWDQRSLGFEFFWDLKKQNLDRSKV